jgi:hypothetical protein
MISSNPESWKLFQKSVLQLANNPESFEELALELFDFQSKQNPVYRRFLELTGQLNKPVSRLGEIPCLPISLFKTQHVKSGTWEPGGYFQSSGTTGMVRSSHWFPDAGFYDEVCLAIFKEKVGSPEDFIFVALLPGYTENNHSSLIHMVENLGKHSSRPVEYLPLDFPFVEQRLIELQKSDKPVFLFSVSYALLRMARQYPISLSEIFVLETGGMKGLDEELPRQGLLDCFQKELGIKKLISEFGMTEMFSQAYGFPGTFETGFSLRVLVRPSDDPFENAIQKGKGLLQVYDLANIASCGFLATQDLAEVYSDRRFEILGRWDHADIRGCNLLFSEV